MPNPLQEKLESLVRVGAALSSEHDLERLLAMIVDEAMELAEADGASLYLRKTDELDFHIARNRSLETRLGPEGMSRLYERFTIPLSRQSMAGYAALTGATLNFADVQDMPEGALFRYNPDFDRKAGYATRSMLTVPLCNREGDCVGVLQLINALRDGAIGHFEPESEMLVRAFSSQAAVAIVNARLDEQLRRSHHETLMRLTSAAEFRDKETSNHIRRMSHFSRILAREAGLPAHEVELIFLSSPMHDVGKIGIPDRVLQKPGLLDPEERRIMESHAVIGAHILKDSDVPVVRQAAMVALTHHEKWDGSGYPRGLAGSSIPLSGRIVALADVFDALSSRRCYKEPWSESKVLGFLVEQKGRHFDPELVDAFLPCLDEIRTFQTRYADTDEDFEKLALTDLPIPEL